MLTLEEVARLVEGEVHGDPGLRVAGVSGLDGLQPGALTFAENARAAREAEASEAGALLTPPGLETRLPSVRVRSPRVAFAVLLEHLHPRRLPLPGIHPTASVHPTAEVHASAHVGPHAVVGEGSVVAERCEIQSRAVVGPACRLGAGTRLLPGAVLGAGVILGQGCLVGALTSLGPGCQVGDDVEMGARCRLDRCEVGAGARIDNLVRVEAGVRLAEHVILVSQCLVGAGARLGRYCIVAGQAMVKPGITVGDGAQVAARSRATEDLPPGQAAWAGDPAIPHREELRREGLRGKAVELHRRVLAGR